MQQDKLETLNTKQILINENRNPKRFDLEDRTYEFAKRTRDYIRKLPKTPFNIEIGGQLFRSAGSVGANYIEANEALGKKDFIMRIKISKKETKESIYWLKLSEPQSFLEKEKLSLIQEATELMKIFGSIAVKYQV